MKSQIIAILTMLFPGLLCQDDPCYDSWVYSKINGKCYKAVNEKMTQSTASTTCKTILKKVNSEFKTKPQLTRMKDENDALAFSNYMISIGNNVPVWLDALYNNTSKSWSWSDRTPINTILLRTVPTSSDLENQCLKFTYQFTTISGVYDKKYGIENESCTLEGYFVCEHDSNDCNLYKFSFSPDMMELVPNSNKPFTYVYVACKFGYYRETTTQDTAVGKAGAIPNDYAYCSGKQHPSKDPEKYKAEWKYTNVNRCLPVTCLPFTGILNNVINLTLPPISNPLTTFPLGYTFNVSCERGYVSYTDRTSTNASVVCQQSLIDKSLGAWAPYDYTPCVAIKCNITSLNAMIPTNAQILSFRNKITQKSYDLTFQRSFLSQFNNIITIQCFDGYFFRDRSWSKEVICDLVNNSLVHADWQGYQGTSLPLYPSCSNSTCKYESILISSQPNLQPYFMMMNNDGVYVNETHPTGNPYPYETRLLFFCTNGSTTASGSSRQNLTCDAQGKWSPNLTPCIVMTPPLNIGSAQRYVPVAVEAHSARYFGILAITILVAVLSLIIILDMSTIAREIKLMKTNIKQLKSAMSGENG